MSGDTIEPPRTRLEDMAKSLRGTIQTMEGLATEFVRAAILRGFYQPGERLQQDAIADLLGMSRMPVRSSLQRLEGEGLVIFHPYRGATVRLLTPSELAEIFELRVLLECRLLEGAWPNLTPGRIERLVSLSERVLQETDSIEWIQQRERFYDELYGVAEMPRTASIVAELRREVGPYLVMRDVAVTERHARHLVALDHIRGGDLEAAKIALSTHLASVSSELQHLLEARLQEVRE